MATDVACVLRLRHPLALPGPPAWKFADGRSDADFEAVAGELACGSVMTDMINKASDRAVVDIGTVLELAASEWLYGEGPLRLRVERARTDLSCYYDDQIWLEGWRLDDAGVAVEWMQALIPVAVIRWHTDGQPTTADGKRVMGRSVKAASRPSDAERLRSPDMGMT
jgi:hypothetical protein